METLEFWREQKKSRQSVPATSISTTIVQLAEQEEWQWIYKYTNVGMKFHLGQVQVTSPAQT